MEQIKVLIDTYEDEAISIRRAIHKKPELSMMEKNTTLLLEEKLIQYGLSLVDDIILPSGTVAILEGCRAGNTLLLRADIDALPMNENSCLPFASEIPGVCHSCGHDIHIAALLLCAKVLSQMKEKLAGRVIFLFQPAEEQNGKGADAVIHSGLFEKYKPDLAVGAHCWPDLPGGCVGFRKGSFMASSDIIKLKIKGRGGHGAHPHRSIDPITVAAYILTELQTVISRNVSPLDSAVLTIGKIIGGTAANVIPDEVVMEGTLRTVNNETRAMVEQRIRTLTEHGAKAMDAECEVDYEKGVPAVVCDGNVVDLLRKAAVEQLGSDHVVDLELPSMGSEDFSKYLELVPGAMFRIGTGNEDTASHLPLHNAGIVFDERAIKTGAAVMSCFTVNYLNMF